MHIITRVVLASLLTLPSSARERDTSPDLFDLVKAGKTEGVRVIVENDPSLVHAVDDLGYTALNWAATRGHWDILLILLDAGADVDHIGADGGTVLHRAAHHDRPDMVGLLIDRGADISIRNQWGRTPLHVAIRRGCRGVAALLLDRGADPDAVTLEGWTPLHVAQMSGQPACVDLLVTAGASTTALDSEGLIPADHAFKRPDLVPLPPERLEEYAGEYDLGGGFSMTVWLEGETLHLMEFAPDEIYPVGEDIFYCRQEPWLVTFMRNDGGTVSDIRVKFLRRTVTGTRRTGVDDLYSYVGSAACGSCHTGEAHGNQYLIWLSSRHAAAYWRLATDWAKQLASMREAYQDITAPIEEERCLRCHITGGNDAEPLYAPGFRQEEGVGCEACHGPGSEYIDEDIMIDRPRFLANGGRTPTAETCQQCHHRPESFSFEEWWKTIAHPRPADPPRP